MINKLTLFGDSIIKGVTYSNEHKKYKLCKLDYSLLEQYEITVENNSRMGSTIDKGFEFITDRRDELDNKTLSIIEFGGNDCNFDWSMVSANPEGEFLPFTPEEMFVAMYRKAIGALKQTGSAVAVATLVPLDSAKFFRWISKGLDQDAILRWLGDENMLGRWQEYYSTLSQRVAWEMGCPIIDLRSEFLKVRNYTELLCEDGIHPTQQGYDLIVDKIIAYTINYQKQQSQKRTG